MDASTARRPRFNAFNTVRDSHFRLVTLGRLALERAGGEADQALSALNARRRKLALLAVLSLARRGVSRDALIEMFWGDQDEARARHSLSDAVSHLRRVLGRASVVATRSEIALAGTAPLVVDAVELTAAAEILRERGVDASVACERMLVKYAGPFLDGVHLEGSASFEQWVSRERVRLERLFVAAAAARCGILRAAGEWSACEVLAERWLEAEPLSANAAVTYFEALVRGSPEEEGESRALAAYERLRARLWREYELEPDPSVLCVAETIHARRRERVVSVRAVSVSSEGGGPPPTSESDAPPGPVHHQSIAHPIEPSPHPAPRRPSRLIALGLSTSIVVAAAFIAAARRSPASSPPRDATVVAIAAIEPATADTSLTWLADGLPQMIAAKLSRSADVEIVPPAQVRAIRLRAGQAHRALAPAELVDIGRRVGATVVVSGGVTRLGEKKVLELDLRTLPEGHVRRITVAVERDILALVDRAAVQLLGAIGSAGSGPTLADLETPSIAAYQHFTRYIQIASEGRVDAALPELDAAIAIDSGFTGALLARLVAAFQRSDSRVVATLNTALRKRADRLTERDRLQWEAWLAQLRGERERSEQLARMLVSRYPRDTRGYVLLADVYATLGRWTEHEQVLDRLLALDSLGMEAGQGPCAPCSAFVGLVEARLVLGDIAGAERAARRWLTLVPEMPVAWAQLGRVLAYRQHYDDAVAAIRHALALTDNDPEIARQLGWTLIMSRRLESVDSLTAAWGTSGVRALQRYAVDLRAIVERERGQFRASNRTIEQALVSFPELGFLELIRANGLARIGEYEEARRSYESLHPLGNPPDSVFQGGDARTFAWHHALLADALADQLDLGTLSALADSIERIGARSYYGRDWRLHHHVRGLIAARVGDLPRAEREFQEARWVSANGWTRTVLELAKVQLMRGRPADAVATLREAYASHPDAMGRYLPRSEIDYWMAVAFRHAGQPDSASVYSGFAGRAWANADPEVKALLAGLP